MTPSEFETFCIYFAESFPDVGRYLTNSGTADQWQKVLASTSLDDAKLAVDAILSGREKFPEPWSLFPAAIRAIASRLVLQRKKRFEIMQEEPEAYRRGSKYPIGTMATFMMDCIRAGMTSEEALAEVNRKFPIADEDQPKHRCLACQDTGHVRVFHHRTVSAIWHDEPKVRKYSAIMLCHCEAGDKRHSNSFNQKLEVTYMATYDPAQCCLYGKGDLTELRQWVADRKRVAVAAQGSLPF